MNNDQGLDLYLSEVRQHIDEYTTALDELHKLNNINGFNYLAAERLLQLLTEVAIGLGKHWLKSTGKGTSSNAYKTFSALEEQNLITQAELLEWKKIIGLRNSLVHDYLEIDKAIVRAVVKEKKYQSLLLFCNGAIKALQTV